VTTEDPVDKLMSGSTSHTASGRRIALPGELPLKKLDVLLVEDNADDALLLERHLRRNGFDPYIVRVETAAEMKRALSEKVFGNLSAVVLADYNLPTFSGPEALKIVRANGLELPFIMLSGAVSEEAAVESMRAGAQDYVTKQNLTRLVPAIERELKEAEARRNRVAAELALRASEARFHRLVEAMPLGLLISDSKGRVIYANLAVERLLGYKAVVPSSAPVADGGLTLDAICPTLPSTIELDHSDASAPSAPFEATCVTASGGKVDVLVGVATLNPGDPSEDRQLAAFLADLTMQKKSEEVLRQTEKLAIAGRLAASIAHEINNPLEAITNCLYLIEQGELEPDSRNYLQMAQRELDLVSKITMQTLRFYRRSSRPMKTDLRDLVESVLDLLDRRVKQQEIEVLKRFRDIPLVLAHEGEIRQVLANLVGNAIDALPEGGKLALRTAPGYDWVHGVPGVRVTVADNGTGMDAAVLSRIFEAFYSTKGITGTGLGLWISRDIVEKHKGRLDVWSRKGTPETSGGTVFSLFLPVESDESAW
jgi:signal transduction histidine kinase/FixJ family two-component response regulator